MAVAKTFPRPVPPTLCFQGVFLLDATPTGTTLFVRQSALGSASEFGLSLLHALACVKTSGDLSKHETPPVLHQLHTFLHLMAGDHFAAAYKDPSAGTPTTGPDPGISTRLKKYRKMVRSLEVAGHA